MHVLYTACSSLICCMKCKKLETKKKKKTTKPLLTQGGNKVKRINHVIRTSLEKLKAIASTQEAIYLSFNFVSSFAPFGKPSLILFNIGIQSSKKTDTGAIVMLLYYDLDITSLRHRNSHFICEVRLCTSNSP